MATARPALFPKPLLDALQAAVDNPMANSFRVAVLALFGFFCFVDGDMFLVAGFALGLAFPALRILCTRTDRVRVLLATAAQILVASLVLSATGLTTISVWNACAILGSCAIVAGLFAVAHRKG
jgi:hypothetical protein